MAIKRMDLAWVTVRDFPKAKHFYQEVLGLTALSVDEENGWIELVGKDGGAVVGVAQTDDVPSEDMHGAYPLTGAVITFTVDDIAQTKKELEDQGVNFIGAIIEVPGHVKIIFFTDPEGNKFQLIEDLEDEEDEDEGFLPE